MLNTMQNCKYTYIGEIGRRFDTRLSEHQKETKRVESKKQNYTCASRKRSQSELSKSAIVDHAVQNNHVINWDNAKIIGKECNTSIRRTETRGTFLKSHLRSFSDW